MALKQEATGRLLAQIDKEIVFFITQIDYPQACNTLMLNLGLKTRRKNTTSLPIIQYISDGFFGAQSRRCLGALTSFIQSAR